MLWRNLSNRSSSVPVKVSDREKKAVIVNETCASLIMHKHPRIYTEDLGFAYKSSALIRATSIEEFTAA